jgi:hypothetical protein
MARERLRKSLSETDSAIAATRMIMKMAKRLSWQEMIEIECAKEQREMTKPKLSTMMKRTPAPVASGLYGLHAVADSYALLEP